MFQDELALIIARAVSRPAFQGPHELAPEIDGGKMNPPHTCDRFQRPTAAALRTEGSGFLIAGFTGRGELGRGLNRSTVSFHRVFVRWGRGEGATGVKGRDEGGGEFGLDLSFSFSREKVYMCC